MPPKILLITDLAPPARITVLEIALVDHATAKKMNATDLNGIELVVLEVYENESVCLDILRKLRSVLRNENSAARIVVLRYKDDEDFVMRAFAAGANHCPVLPTTSRMFLARCLAWLSPEFVEGPPGEACSFWFDPEKREVTTPQGTYRLSPLEAELLNLLIANCGQSVTTDRIIQRVWPDHRMGDDARHLLKALVHRLRRKIEADPTHPQYIHTVPHQGYSFGPQ